MALITAQDLADELHIDSSPVELATLGTLIKDASAIIRGSIDSQLTEQAALELASEQFNRLVGSVASSLYYDRALTSGFSHGQMVILLQLTGLIKGGA